MSESSTGFTLRSLPWAARFSLSCLVLVLLGGFAASAIHLIWHHENRDERKGLSIDDIRGAYHGVQTRAPLLVALERNHPPELPAAERQALEAWLKGGRISEEYDSLDKGDMAPAEIISRSCLKCHAAAATEGGGIGKTIPLEYLDQVTRLASSREVRPTDLKILAASTHTHAISLGLVSIVVCGLLWATRWPRWLVSTLIVLVSVNLLVDLAAWWLSRSEGSLVGAIIVAGGLFNGCTVLALLAILADLWRPARRSAA
jgi:hypothetical protein